MIPISYRKLTHVCIGTGTFLAIELLTQIFYTGDFLGQKALTAIAGTIFGAIFARHAIFILAVVAITAFPAWTGSKIAALFRPQSDREEGGE